MKKATLDSKAFACKMREDFTRVDITEDDDGVMVTVTVASGVTPCRAVRKAYLACSRHPWAINHHSNDVYDQKLDILYFFPFVGI